MCIRDRAKGVRSVCRKSPVTAVMPGAPKRRAVSYTHLDVYKRQAWYSMRPKSICLKSMLLIVLLYMAVSYTHLDVYKRQEGILSSVH